MSFSITINVHPYGEAGEAVPRAGDRGLFFYSFSERFFIPGWWVKKHSPQPEGERERSITCRKEIHKCDLSNASIFPPKPN